MKRIAFIILIILVSTNLLNAQKKSNVMFFEIGGPGLASFNYDRRFTNSDDGFGARIGVGGIGSTNSESIGVITFPIGLNYLATGDHKNYFELGINQTFLSANSNIFNSNNTITTSFTTLNFGYRLQPIKNGFVFKAAVNPIIVDGTFFPFYFGIGFGYKF